MEEALADALSFLAVHGHAVVFLWIFADQAGLPIPSIPLLIAAGAMTATGELSLFGVIAFAAAGSILADSMWFALGRYNGEKAIGLVCKLALEPDSCVSTTRAAFGRFGPLTLVIAKFLPGVQTLAPASAGFVRAPWVGFLLLDLLGTLLFVAPFVLGGHLFQPQLLALLEWLGGVSGGIGLLIAAVLGVYLLAKATQWIVFFKQHRMRRVSAETLLERLEGDPGVTVIDLRQRLDFELEPRAIPGALRIPINEIQKRRHEIPTRYDVVLVCT